MLQKQNLGLDKMHEFDKEHDFEKLTKKDYKRSNLDFDDRFNFSKHKNDKNMIRFLLLESAVI